jgi:hypothetical protein
MNILHATPLGCAPFFYKNKENRQRNVIKMATI